MKVLVTGGAGFIGSNFVHYACEQRPGWSIVVLDKLTYAGNLESLAGLVQEKRVEFLRTDICDADIGQLFLKHKFDLVFHFAAESHVDRSIHAASEFVRTNVLGTQNLLDCALAHKVKRFVHVSTDEVYGSLGPQGSFRETTALDPTSPYAASKAASDVMVLACYKTHNFDTIVTRCTNNYGPYQFPEKLIPLFVTNALDDKDLPLYGDGMNVRSWLFVRDHVEALILVAEKGLAGRIYNIGPNQDGELSNRAVTEQILGLLSKPASLVKLVKDRPAHDRRYAVDSDRLRRELGWKAATSFDKGLAQTVAWYQTNRSWWQHIKSGEYLAYYNRNYGGR